MHSDWGLAINRDGTVNRDGRLADRPFARGNRVEDRQVDEQGRQELIADDFVGKLFHAITTRVKINLNRDHSGGVTQLAENPRRAVLRYRADHASGNRQLE